MAEPFVVPEGKRTVGEPIYEEDDEAIRQIFAVEDIPAPLPLPTTEQKLEALGFTIAELKAVLA